MPTARWIEVPDAADGLWQAPLVVENGLLTPLDAPDIGLEWREDMAALYRA